MTARIYKPGIEKTYDLIVIGSGIGGLSLAAIAAKEGKRVLVLEKHYVAGGFTHTFSRKGYEWDVGLHYIGEVHREQSLLRQLFDHITDGELKWQPMPDVYDKIVFGDESYDLVAGEKNFIARLSSYFPDEHQAIVEYVRLIKEANRTAKNFFMEKALPGFIQPFASPFLSKPFLKFSDHTTLDVVSRLTRDRKLIGVLTAQYGDYGLPPSKGSFMIHALIARHYLNGGAYPIGGSSRIADTIIPLIEAAGGDVLIRADVTRIVTEGNRAIGVQTAQGEVIRAPAIASNAGVVNTFGRMLDEPAQQRLNVRKRLGEVSPSLSHVCAYIGFKATDDDMGFKGTNWWIYPDYDHDATIAAYARNPREALPVVYTSFPSAKDPTFQERHPGRSTMEVVGFAPYEWFQQWENKPWMKRGLDYEAKKQELQERYMETVYRYFPQTKGRIDHIEFSTPLSTKHFSNYSKGEIYGIEHTPERFRLKWLTPKTPIKGLYLTGQDIVTDGIGGALMGGVLAASVVLKKNVMKGILSK